jgi:hypothetical protein
MSFWWYWGIELLKLGKELAIACAIGLLLFGVLYALWAYLEFRPVKLLGTLRCRRCGTPFGRTTARTARAEYRQGVQEAFRNAEREHGVGMRIQFDTKWYFACPACQAPHTFDAHSHTLEDDDSPDGA